jgi:hypothetical protein
VKTGQWALFTMGTWQWECTHLHPQGEQWWGTVPSESAAVVCIAAHNYMCHPHLEVKA